MNEMLKLMHDRRSTRAYRPEPLQEAVIQQILEAGRFAPSGMNKQLNHFYVITDPNYLADLTALVSRKMENYRDKDFRYGAPVLVLVTNQKESTTCVQDASCAMENMMLRFGIGYNTLLNTSTSHIAEMIIKGSNNGVLEMEMVLAHNEEFAGSPCRSLAKELIEMENANIRTLKEYL